MEQVFQCEYRPDSNGDYMKVSENSVGLRFDTHGTPVVLRRNKVIELTQMLHKHLKQTRPGTKVILAEFWIVWGPKGTTNPSYTFDSHLKAKTAADNMAQRFPGQKFYVMKAKGVSELPATQPTYTPIGLEAEAETAPF